LYEKHPNLSPEVLDQIVQEYFQTAKEGISGLKNIEVTLLFGSFKFSQGKYDLRLPKLQKYIDNYNNPEVNKLSEESYNTLVAKMERLSQLNTKKEEFSKKESIIQRTGKKKKRKNSNLYVINAEQSIIQRVKDIEENK
jgi:hypothetical protein